MQEYSPRFYSFSRSNVAVDRLSIGIEYCQKYVKKYRRYLDRYCIRHDDTCRKTQKVSPILLVAMPIQRY